MTELTPEARSLLAGARDFPARSAEDRARVREALRARLAAEAPPVAAVPPRTATPAASALRKFGPRAGLAGTALVAALLGPLAYYASHRGAPATVEPTATATSVTTATGASPGTTAATVAPVASNEVSIPMPNAQASASPEPSEPGAPSASAAPVRPRAPALARARPSVAPESTLAAELALLRPARSSAPAQALALLDEHARRYPRGVLAEERQAQRIVALCGLGRRDEATTALAAFERAYPQSPHTQRARRACAP